MVHNNALAGSSNSQPTPDSIRPRSRVQFSDDQGSSGAEFPVRIPRVGAGSPPSRKATREKADLHKVGSDGRRRVRSFGAKGLLPSDAVSSLGMFPTKRSLDMARSPDEDSGLDPVINFFGPSALSDEYDLSNEDPKILKDVQHALKLKARREARLQGLSSSSPPKEMHSRASPSSESRGSSPAQVLFPAATPKPQQIVNASAGSEIDFSPSTGTTPLHPVPLSSNGGATLDWTGSLSDDEKSDRKWTLSIMAKTKDRLPITNHTIIEKQDSIFTDKIARIKVDAKPHTLRKAQITSEQLKRRYDIVYRSLNGPSPVNPISAVRWYTSSAPDLQAVLDETEPLTWLKHLLDKRGRKPTGRLPWHLTALIFEEFIRSQTRPETMETILEDSSAVSPSIGSQQSPKVPSHIVRSRPSSHNSFGPSISRLSYDGHVSFEPYLESTRTSWEGEPRRSDDAHLRTPLPGIADSPHSSLYSSNLSVSSNAHVHNRHDIGPSPPSSRLQIRDLTNRIRRRPHGSDDGSSSAHNSLSEDQIRSDDGGFKRRTTRRNPRPADIALTAAPPDTNREVRDGHSIPASEVEDVLDSNDPPQTVKVRHAILSDDGEPTAVIRSDHKPEVPVQPSPSTPRTMPRKGARLSLPSGRVFEEDQKRHHRQEEADEDQTRIEYELKSRLLKDTRDQNLRLRQLLHRIGAGVREYDSLQRNLMKSLGMRDASIPSDLLDAFSHDPASATIATRRYRGWRAVEDIHNRVIRQRETIRTFLAVSEEHGFSPPDSVFDDPIAALAHTLDNLEEHKKATMVKAREVSGILTTVKGTHASVKTEYNETLSHTSVVYPELSQIVALEESYKNSYQQLWEIGMDTLTLLLDTVTPFWRNYGKTIGEDVQDFLIVPLYRNEFTGEAKRYPILRPPKRSLRHWLGLMVFFVTSVGVTMLQGRAAISFVSYYRLPWTALDGFRWAVMPFFWFSVLVQMCIVLIEFCIVFAQLGVVTWWIGWLLKIFA